MAALLNQPLVGSMREGEGAYVGMREGDTPLTYAAWRGCVADVVALLADGADVNELKTEGSPGTKGATALFFACKEGHAEVVTTLLAANAKVGQPNKVGVTPLMTACQNGYAGIVITLIAANADVNEAPQWARRSFTPLYLACRHGHAEVLTALMLANADVNRADCDGYTPMVTAGSLGDTKAISMLLVADASPNVACVSVGTSNIGGMTPLYAACYNAHVEAVKMLLAANATVDQATDDGTAPLHIACQAPPDPGDDSEEPQMFLEAHTEIVAILLAAGASVDLKKPSGATAMYIACHEGHLGIVQLLSSYGAHRFVHWTNQPHALLGHLGIMGWASAPVVAERRGHLVVAAWLHETNRWRTALHHLDVLTLQRALTLLRAGGDIYAATSEEDLSVEEMLNFADEEGNFIGPRRVRFGPSPLSLAQAAAAAGGAAAGTAAFLVLEAAKPWSCQTHRLFPPAARERAVELMLIGELLSREERFAAYGPQAVFDAWVGCVVPEAVDRSTRSLDELLEDAALRAEGDALRAEGDALRAENAALQEYLVENVNQLTI